MKQFPIETPDEAIPVYVKKTPWSERTLGLVSWVLDVVMPMLMAACFSYAFFLSSEEAADAFVALWIGFMFWLPQWLTHHAQLELRRDIKGGPWVKALIVFYACVAALVLSAMFKKSDASCACRKE